MQRDINTNTRQARQGSPLSLWGVAILCFVVVLMVLTPRIPQPKSYHDFADKRKFFGIPYTLDVTSNFPFLAIGLAGLALCYYGNYVKMSLQGEVLGWTVFYTGIATVAFGSSYYHLNPNDDRLVWDRLPMAIALAGILTIFVIERVDEKRGILSIIPSLLGGVGSVIYWRRFDDLRPYAIVETVPCIAIVLMALWIPPRYTHSTYWLWAAGCLLLARIGELADKPIYKLSFHRVSGHTLKHVFAAILAVILTLMLVQRDIQTERISLLQRWRMSSRNKAKENGTKVN
nr:uncharacterized protein LOC109167172 [Ipomoea batatas]